MAIGLRAGASQWLFRFARERLARRFGARCSGTTQSFSFRGLN
jgi:hypothetical protein